LHPLTGGAGGLRPLRARRCGFKVAPWQRFTLSAFIFSTFLAGTVRAETSTAETTFWGITDRGMGLPGWLETAATAWLWLTAAAFIVVVLHWSWQNRRPLPLIVLLPAVTQYVWFVEGAKVPAFAEFVPFFHSLQYLLIAWSVQLKEKMDQQQIRPSPRYVLGESLRWGGINFLGGALLFFGLPHLLAQAGVGLAFATGVVICGVQIHHFFVDGVIWKLRN